MFRLHKTRPAKKGHRIEFKFSHFKALQVPRGWEKLCVSIMSVETGKTLARSSKAAVRNGSCQWTEALSESVLGLPSQDDSSKNRVEDCLLKLVLSMGSTRSGVLGEALVNIADYMDSGTAVPASFTLKKCNHGTVLQAKIQCLIPRSTSRDDESKESDSNKNDNSVETKSEDSDGAFLKSGESDQSSDLSYTTKQEHGTKDADMFTSGSRHSYDSADSFVVGESLSPTGKTVDNKSSSQTGIQQGSYHTDNRSDQSDRSSVNSVIIHSEKKDPHDEERELAAKSLLETAEVTIEELRREAKIWERNVTKLQLDLDILRKEYSEQSRNQDTLRMELATACVERDGYQKELEKMKLLLEKSILKPAVSEDLMSQDGRLSRVVKEMEEEIKYQQEYNSNLNQQLKRSQESNAELVSALQELEEVVEKQHAELSALQSKFHDMENCSPESLETNRDLMQQLAQLQESERNLRTKIQEMEQSERNLQDIETKYKLLLSAKDEEIVSLKENSAKNLEGNQVSREMDIPKGDDILIRENEELRCKLQELENDCQELTDENLELLLKLNEVAQSGKSNSLSKSGSFGYENSIHNLEEKLKKRLLSEFEHDFNLSVKELECLRSELETEVKELSKELGVKKSEIEALGAALLSKEQEVENFRSYQKELKSKLYVVQKEKDELAVKMVIVTRESEIATKCMNDVQKDLTMLSRSVHMSANKKLERKSLELEVSKQEVELCGSELRQGNEELMARICNLEAELIRLTDEKESVRSELENSKSHASSLRDEIANLRNEIEIQKTDLNHKLQETDGQLAKAHEELEYLRRGNPDPQDSVESLKAECNSLQETNEDLKQQNLKLQGHSLLLEAQLDELRKEFNDCSKKVKNLEELLRDSYTKEKIVSSEVEALQNESEKQEEKFSLLDQMYKQKEMEVEKLQQELGNLGHQVSEMQDERERMASNAEEEVAGLQTSLTKLESQLNAMETESKMKVKDLEDELTTSKQDQESLKAENNRVASLLASYRMREEKIKTSLNGLELQLTVSEYERQQLTEESTNLKTQLLEIETLQDEKFSLNNDLSTTKSEKESLEIRIQQLSEECKDLNAQKVEDAEKITTFEKAVWDLTYDKQNRAALEEKLLDMEEVLASDNELQDQEAELRNELTRIKRANEQLQHQMQDLKMQNHKFAERAESLEQEPNMEKEQHCINQNGKGNNSDNFHIAELKEKIKFLEDELSRATDANHKYKVQIKRLTSEGKKSHTSSLRKSTTEDEVVTKQTFERTKSSLEAELKDIRDRYFHMSLKYAEVESQREELVMKLKAIKNGKSRWF